MPAARRHGRGNREPPTEVAGYSAAGQVTRERPRGAMMRIPLGYAT